MILAGCFAGSVPGLVLACLQLALTRFATLDASLPPFSARLFPSFFPSSFFGFQLTITRIATFHVSSALSCALSCAPLLACFLLSSLFGFPARFIAKLRPFFAMSAVKRGARRSPKAHGLSAKAGGVHMQQLRKKR